MKFPWIRVATQPHPQQRGVALILTLIMLAAMMLGGIALYRKIGLGAMIAGNLSFTSAAITAAEQGSEAARAWLIDPTQSPSRLEVVQPTGYFPASCYTDPMHASNVDCTDPNAPRFDPTTVGDAWWTTYGTCANGVDATSADADDCIQDGAGNKIRYVIHRLCNQGGSLTNGNGNALYSQQCMQSITQSNAQHTDQQEPQATAYPLYRVTTRVRGPRNTTAYTQITMF